ncbi:MAG: polyprenyl synthetase family protein [Dehalococcoidales bacterium]|nr:polyprenyl synthetase family protein [Dehalococcoidales bacterium]
MTSLPASFERYAAEIKAELQLVLAEREAPLYDIMRYHFGWVDERGNPRQGTTGKALRPTLCLLTCEAVGGDYRRALPAAITIELVHNFSLILDDIQDDDRERRHSPTVWSIWGKPQAINVGTAMRLMANLALSRLEKCGVSMEKQLAIQHLIDEATLSLLEGQFLDISYESHFDIEVTDYLSMIEGKTAALIACSLEVGALLGTDDQEMAKHFREIGKNLGLAFQIRDDILGIWGEEEKTGKPLGSDIRHRKRTFPIVYILEKAGNRLRQELVDVYQNGEVGSDGIATVLTILESANAQFQAQKMAEKYCSKALKAIDSLALLPSVSSDLKEVAHFLIERDF